MGLIEKSVKIIPSGKMISYYKNKGYDVQWRKEIEISVDDLPENSNIKVLCECDYCGEKIRIRYYEYKKHISGNVNKIACSNCANKKCQESNIIKYGVSNVFQLDEVKEKSKNTSLSKYGTEYYTQTDESKKHYKEVCFERYGTDHPQKNESIRQKTQNTCLERYGVISPSMSEDIKQKTKETNIQRYGFPYASSSQEVKDKMRQTCLERYGSVASIASDEIREKAKQTIIDRYGVESYSKTNEYKQKIKQTMKEKYGVEYASQSVEIRNKMKATSLEKWGYEYPQQSPLVQEKVKQTSLKRYGTISPTQNESVKNKIKKTNIEKYGYESCLKNPEIITKRKQTNLIKYGFENVAQSPQVKSKIANSLYNNNSAPCSKQQLYLCDLFMGNLNYPIHGYNTDICLIDEKITIEYDGGGHFLSVKRGELTEKEFNQKELVRDQCIKREGYKVMRIISRKDYLPSDTILLQMLQYARDFFASNPDRSWINFDIDQKCIYNAYYKESSSGLPYDYGKLRKIKKEHLSSHSSQTLLQPSAQ